MDLCNSRQSVTINDNAFNKTKASTQQAHDNIPPNQPFPSMPQPLTATGTQSTTSDFHLSQESVASNTHSLVSTINSSHNNISLNDAQSIQLHGPTCSTPTGTNPDQTFESSTSRSGLQAKSTSHQYLHFQALYEALYLARLKWHNLGLALGLDNTTLECIGEKERDNHDKCLRSMLKNLEARSTSETLTWDKISQALESPTVQMNALASDIRNIKTSLYIPQSSNTVIPSCVHSYTNFLKEKHRNMSMFPDEWPPPLVETFSKLALISVEKQKLEKATYMSSIEHDYATGNIDNIVASKQDIEIEQAFKPQLDENNYNKYIAIIDGAPGVGKTTLTRKICIDWAEGKLLTDHQIVILKPLREMRGRTTDSLSDILQADDPELKEEVIKHIQKTSGSGVMFIFDGFDELSSKQRIDKTFLFWKIIQGDYLHKCSVLVTSRSYASGPLQIIRQVNRHVEVLGFKSEDIEQCIRQNLRAEEQAEKLIKMLKERLDIVSLCYIPLNCRIVLYVYQKLGTLPDTLTQLYEVFILYTIKHYKDKLLLQVEEGIDDNEIELANSVNFLPKPITDDLDYLSKVAFTGLLDNKIIFDNAEIKTKRSTLSSCLLNSITHTGKLEDHYYQFLHLTIQEFLAARHLATVKSNEELLEFFSTHLDNDRFRMTLLFLSGLTKLKFFPINQPLLNPDKEVIRFVLEYVDHFTRFLLLTHILYESQQTTYNWLLPCLVTNSLDLSGHPFTQFDCLVLANFLAMTPEDHVWDEIDLSWCDLSEDSLQILLRKKHKKQHIPVLLLTKKLNLSSNGTHSLDLLTPVLMKDSHVESLTISSNNVPDCKDCILSDTKTLKEVSVMDGRLLALLITTNQVVVMKTDICSGIFQKLMKCVPTKSLKKLIITPNIVLESECFVTYRSCKHNPFSKYQECLDNMHRKYALQDCLLCGSSGDDAWKRIANMDMKHCLKIHIDKLLFSEDEVSFLYEKLTNCTNLSLIQLHSESNIPLKISKLIDLQQSTQACVQVEIILHNKVNLSISVKNDKFVYIEIDDQRNVPLNIHNYHFYTDSRDSALKELNLILPTLLEEDIPPELHGVTVTTKSYMSTALLTLLKKSKTLMHLTLSELDLGNDINDGNHHAHHNLGSSFFTDFKEMLSTSKTLQTLTINNCVLGDAFIELLKKGLPSNVTISFKARYQQYFLTSKLFKAILTFLQVKKVQLNNFDHDKHFFNALLHNQSLQTLTINTTKEEVPLSFQTILSTSVTTLKIYVGCEWNTEYRIEASRAFKTFVNENRVLTNLTVFNCGLTDEAFDGIIFKKESPLVKLSILNNKDISSKGWTHLFNSLCLSHITTLDISDYFNSIPSESDCYKALLNLLVNNKFLTVLKIGCNFDYFNVVSCISEALSQNCTLQELSIIINNSRFRSQPWAKLFRSLNQNSKLQKLDSISHTNLLDTENIESLCEMLKLNKGLQSLSIHNDLIKDHLEEFAMAYVQRQPVLHLTVEDLDFDLFNEIEKHQPDPDYEQSIDYIFN